MIANHLKNNESFIVIKKKLARSGSFKVILRLLFRRMAMDIQAFAVEF